MKEEKREDKGVVLNFPDPAEGRQALFEGILERGLTAADAKMLGAAGLRALLGHLETAYAELEGEEPDDEESEEYEEWMEELEALDDLMDEAHERLEELE